MSWKIRPDDGENAIFRIQGFFAQFIGEIVAIIFSKITDGIKSLVVKFFKFFNNQHERRWSERMKEKLPISNTLPACIFSTE